MTKADLAISSIPWIIVTSDDFCNDGMPSDLLFPSGTYIDVELDVRVETTTPNEGDISIEGKVSDVILSKLQIQRKIMPICRVKLDRPKWLLENWRFETKVSITGATAGIFDRYYIETVSSDKFRSKNEYSMTKTRGDIVKLSVPKASKNKKRNAEEVSRSSKKKKIVVEEPKSNSDSDTMTEIDNYEDSSAHASDDV
uniref:DNA binding protein n=2 Tax=Solanum tuberosum TaxID=4113 RepID=M1C9H3_SOLTU